MSYVKRVDLYYMPVFICVTKVIFIGSRMWFTKPYVLVNHKEVHIGEYVLGQGISSLSAE